MKLYKITSAFLAVVLTCGYVTMLVIAMLSRSMQIKYVPVIFWYSITALPLLGCVMLICSFYVWVRAKTEVKFLWLGFLLAIAGIMQPVLFFCWLFVVTGGSR